MVLAEFMNDFGARGAVLRQAASSFLSRIRSEPGLTVIPQTSAQFWEAAELFGQRSDKEWSLTDCASCVVMQREGIHDALTYDHHFEQMGFRALLRPR